METSPAGLRTERSPRRVRGLDQSGNGLGEGRRAAVGGGAGRGGDPGRRRRASLRMETPSAGTRQRAIRRSRKALPMTETELNVIAALAIIGLSRIPNHGYSTPAAIGTPSAL